MRTEWAWLAIICLCVPMWGLGQARAQDPGAPSRATQAEPVEEVQPSGFYLRNEKGELVYVPDITYEQFERMLKAQRNLENPERPAVVMTDMAIEGEVTGDRLELRAVLTLQGQSRDDQPAGTWLPVPLAFANGVLQKEPGFTGPGGHFLTFDSLADGYVCWLQLMGDVTHQVTLPLALPIERSGDESRVTLKAPMPLASSVRITIPAASAEGVLRAAAANGQPMSFTALPDGRSELSARGVRGDSVLVWRTANAPPVTVDSRLDVLGAVTVTADEMLQEVSSMGQFQVRGFAGALETFRIRLPAGMRLRETPEPGYQVRLVPPEQRVPPEEGTEATSQVVEIRLDRPASGEVSVRLTADVPTVAGDPTPSETVSQLIDQAMPFEPARYEFLGAVRHRGHIDFVIRGDWALESQDDPAFPRVDPGPSQIGAPPIAARFGYHDQEHALSVVLRQKAARIAVEPTYHVYVDARQARLVAELDCRASGSKAVPLAMRLPFWTVEAVRFVDFDSGAPVELAETNPLIVPIPVAAQVAGRFTLLLEARQDLTASVVSGTMPLRIVLPLLEATNPARANVTVSPATVVVAAADNILLTPRPQQLKALSSLAGSEFAGDSSDAASSTPANLPENAVRDLARAAAVQFRYRDRGSSEQAVFVGDVKIQPQAITVSFASISTLSRAAIHVEQQFSYVVQHEATQTLQFTLPPVLATDAGRGWRVFLDEQPLIPNIEPAAGAEAPRAWVRLPQPMLGQFTLRVQFASRQMPALNTDAATRTAIPLLIPATRNGSNTTLGANTLTVVRDGPMHVEASGDAWIVESSESGAGKVVLAATRETPEAMLLVSLKPGNPGGTTVLRQVWIQSWLTDATRRDRAVFRFTTSEPQLRVVLPRDAEHDVHVIECLLDGRQVAVEAPDEHGELTLGVPNTNDAGASEHVLEVWYFVQPGLDVASSTALQAAALQAQDRVERTYWQVLLPRGDIAVCSDDQVAAECRWQWDRIGWRRQPVLDQDALEQWIGGTREDPVPEGMNRYLFTTPGAMDRLELTIVSRTSILLAFSGVALAIGLAMIYVPLLRHPAWLFPAGIATITTGLLVPDWAILFAQAAVGGILLTILASAIRQWMGRTRWGLNAVHGRTQFSDSKIRKSEASGPRMEGSSRHSVTDDATSVPVSAADSKP